MNNKLTKSLETYLMTVDKLLENNSSIIVKDVATYLNYGGASVSTAIKKLKNLGFVNYEPYGNITLTEKGKDIVFLKKYRNETITKFLNKVLDIDIEQAKKNAKSIEYSMTEDVLVRFVNFMDFMEQCACSEQRWVNSCKNALSCGHMSSKCKNCNGDCCCSK